MKITLVKSHIDGPIIMVVNMIELVDNFVPTECNLPIGEGLLRYSWLAEEFDVEVFVVILHLAWMG
jgi:hypothetical protein